MINDDTPNLASLYYTQSDASRSVDDDSNCDGNL